MMDHILGLLLLVVLYVLPFVILFSACFFGKRNIPYFMSSFVAIFGLCGILWEFALFYQYYRQSMAEGAWTAATVTIGLAPFYAIKTGFITALMGLGFGFVTHALMRWYHENKNSLQLFIIGGMLILVSAAAIYLKILDIQERNVMHQHEAIAKSSSLTRDQINEIVQRYQNDPANQSEMIYLLRNPVCPEKLLREYAERNDLPMLQTAVASNRRIPLDLLIALSKSPSSDVRYYAVYNPKLPIENLKLLQQDPVEIVRNAANQVLGMREKSLH